MEGKLKISLYLFTLDKDKSDGSICRGPDDKDEGEVGAGEVVHQWRELLPPTPSVVHNPLEREEGRPRYLYTSQ